MHESTKQMFLNSSIDDLITLRTKYFPESEEGRALQRILEMKVLGKETPAEAIEEAGEPSPSVTELDGTLCPPTISRPSTASFDGAVERDPNSTTPQEDLFGPELKPPAALAREAQLSIEELNDVAPV